MRKAWPWGKYGIAETDNPACVPAKRTDWAWNYHLGMRQLKNKESFAVLFLGDSIMNDIWRSRSAVYAERVKEGGNEVWEKYYKPLPAANFGVSGDETGHLLWRITEGGALEGFHPKIVVLLVGVNNLLREQTSSRTAEGVGIVVNYLKDRLPDAKILLLGIFPCWQPASNPIREKIRETNLRISKLNDRKSVFYLDLGDCFLEADGSVSTEKLHDTLHPSEQGYAVWAEGYFEFLKAHRAELLP